MYKILVVEDMKWIRKGIVSILREHAADFSQVLEASNGKEALDMIKINVPNIIITDIKMPEVNGIELIREVKSTYPHIRFIIISGYAEFEYAEQALNMGVSGYILKPIQDKNFNEAIEKVVNDLNYSKDIQDIKSRQERLEKNNERLTLEQKINEIMHTHTGENPSTLLELQWENENLVLGLINIDGNNYYQSEFKYEDLELIKFGIINIMNELNSGCK